jgi:ubiquinone/menaquinone biosynthesis C-methylase UbiE
MHSFTRHRHSEASKASAKETKGLILTGGWRYDLMEWFIDTFVFRGQVRQLRQRTAGLARLQLGDAVLDVGCGTGTLAMEVARRVGRAGHVAGVDPSPQQIARARSKAARRNAPIDFQIGVIEQLAFPDQTFDVVLSTLMMHHLPTNLKRQGLSEIARVLKPGGAPGHCRFQAQAGTSGPDCALSRRGERHARSDRHSLGCRFPTSGNGGDAAPTILRFPRSRLCPCIQKLSWTLYEEIMKRKRRRFQ